MEDKISNLKSENENSSAKDQHTSETCETKTAGVSQHETNISENENIFQKSAKKLLHVRQVGNSPSETFDSYMNKLNGLYSDHIDTLIHEKSDLNKELQNIQKKQKENHNLTISRVDTLLTVLRSWTDTDKFSDKNMKKAILEKVKYYTNFRKILIQLSGRNVNSLQYPNYSKCGDSVTRRVETIQLRREVKDRDDEIEELKKEMENMIKDIHFEREKKCEILSVLKCGDDNCFLKLLIQTQVELEALNQEVNKELKEILQTISDDKQFEDNCHSEDSQNALSTDEASSKPSPAENEGSSSSFFNQQLELMQNKLQTFHKEFKSQTSVIRQAFNNFRANIEEDMFKVKVQLSVGTEDLEKFEPEQIKAMLRKAEAEAKMLQDELSFTLQELSALQVDCYMKEGTIDELVEKEKKAIEECNQVTERVKTLEKQLVELQNVADETSDLLERCNRILEHKVQQEQLTAKKLKDTEKKVKTLQSQLAGTQHELAIVSKENSRLKNFQKNMK